MATAKRNTKFDYLLRGMLDCKCGARMHGMTKRRKHSYCSYYICDGARQMKSSKVCHEPLVRADVIEPMIWDGVKTRAKDLTQLERELKLAQQGEIDNQAPKREELENIEGMLADAERDAAEIGRALRIAQGAVEQSLKRDMDEVNARCDRLTRRRAELQAELAARRLTDEAVGEILAYARDVREGIDNATFDDERRTLELLLVHVWIDGKRFHLKSLLGDWDGEMPSSRSCRGPASTVDAGYLLESCRCRPWGASRGTRCLLAL